MTVPPRGAEWKIRPVGSIAEFHACEDLQRQAWGFGGDLDIIPLTQMLAAQKAGGVVLGAFSSAGRLLGFCYGFIGRRDTGELIHYSHMLAVDPNVRAAGVGAALKWAQRDAVLAQGIQWMLWTYDPLESLNGYLNFSKLGVLARTYWEDLYGQTSSGLHQGTATDRLLAEWPLSSVRVRRRAEGHRDVAPGIDSARPILAARDFGGSLIPGQVLTADGASVSIEVPASIQTIKANDPSLGQAWRSSTREAFTQALSGGYYVAECQRHNDRTFYLLRHGEFPDDTAQEAT
ncbi:MAG: hypothetical protein GKS06_07310 [Acidobacteria bacterium]|nr:hypothetical protein [Acidobacteriota bacterium]